MQKWRVGCTPLYFAQMERIGYHASVVVWAGNNENELGLVDNWYGTKDNFSSYESDYLSLYVDTIYQQVDSTLPSITNFVVSCRKTIYQFV